MFLFIHTYLNYGSTAWTAIAKNNLKKLYNQQIQAVRTVFNENIHISSNALFTELNILKIYKLNIFQNNV